MTHTIAYKRFFQHAKTHIELLNQLYKWSAKRSLAKTHIELLNQLYDWSAKRSLAYLSNAVYLCPPCLRVKIIPVPDLANLEISHSQVW